VTGLITAFPIREQPGSSCLPVVALLALSDGGVWPLRPCLAVDPGAGSVSKPRFDMISVYIAKYCCSSGRRDQLRAER